MSNLIPPHGGKGLTVCLLEGAEKEAELKKAIKEWQMVKKVDPDYKDITPNLKKAEMLFKKLESIKKSTPQ